MKKLLFLFFVLPFAAFSQNLQLTKATEQTINHGASPTASTNYIVLLKKAKSFNWSVDSVYSIADNKKVNYNIVKLDDPASPSPRYEKLTKFEKNYIGLIQITFASMKSLGDGGRRNVPTIEIGEQNDYSSGVTIYYTSKMRKVKATDVEKTAKAKNLKVIAFEKLETINAP